MSFQQSDARESNYRAAEAHAKRVEGEAKLIFDLFKTADTSLLIPALIKIAQVEESDEEKKWSWYRSNIETIELMKEVADTVLEKVKNLR